MTIQENGNGNGNGSDPVIQEQVLDHFMEQAYRRYAILTILDRALPDVRDGLKPSQRRILYAMHDMNLVHNQPHKKSARVVGEVLGKYHPHGDQSVYDAMVRLAQDFSMRDPLIDGQGNFGSIDGDGAAAMRYTEARLSSVGEAMLYDLEKGTVDWRPNFDGSLKEPAVLPNRIPNLLVNGVAGIAVGMSTSILPHNLGEVCEAVIFMAKNWKRKEKISIEELMKIIPGPDLPTGGLLYRFRANGDGEKHDMIRQAYETGNATMVCQAKADMKDIGGGKAAIIITELPYQTQKTTILERIASSRDKFPGLTDVRDESDYKGMRVVFEVARGTDPQDVLDRLFTHTQMRDSLSYNALALVQAENGKSSPKVLTLADILSEFINHRLNVITRRAKFDLDKAEARLHIVEGLLKALSMIDEVVKIIRNSQNTETARTNLMRKLALSEIQAQAILDMPLKRLSSLERNKLEEEKKELKINIGLLKEILRSEEKRLSIVVEETDEIKNKFSSPRKTLIIETEEGHQAKVTVADLVVPSEPQLVCFSQSRVARLNAKDYRESVVKGKVSGRAVDIFIKRETVQPDETLLLITNRGRLWQGNVGRLPQEAGFDDIGLVRNEKVIASGIATPGKSLYLVTRNGNIKRVSVEDCINSRSEATWGMVIGLNGDDELLMAAVGSDQAHILVTTSGTAEITPRTLRFEASSINAQATPSAKGVAAIKMMDDAVIGAALIEPERFKHYMLYLTDKGFTKKVSLEEYPLQGRGGQGVQVWKLNSTTGIITDFTIIPTKGMVDVFSSAYKRIRFVEDEIPQSTRIGKGIDLGAKYNNGELFPGEKAIGVVFAGS